MNGDWGWGLGIGDWGLGIGPNPQSPIPILFYSIFDNYIFTDEIQKNVVAVLSNIVVENKKRIILLNRIIEISLI